MQATDAAAGRRHGPHRRRRSTQQVKPSVRLRHAGDRDPPRRRRRADRASRRRRPRPIIASARCRRQSAGAHPERFLAGQEGGAARASTICTSVKVAFEAPRFWETRRLSLRRPRLDRPAQRECDLPVGRLPRRARACWSRAYVAGWTNHGNPRQFAALSHRRADADQRASRSRRCTRASRGC